MGGVGAYRESGNYEKHFCRCNTAVVFGKGSFTVARSNPIVHVI